MFEAWTLSISEIKADEERLRQTVRELDDQARAAYFRESKNRLRDPDTYAVLNYFFLTGMHHFYLGKYVRGIFNLTVLILGLFLLFLIPPLGVLLAIGICLIELPNLFRSQAIVADHNNSIGHDILREHSHASETGSMAGVEKVPNSH